MFGIDDIIAFTVTAGVFYYLNKDGDSDSDE